MEARSGIEEDIIAAIATAPGPAGIAIVRVAGPGCLSVADRVIRCKLPVPSQRAGGTFVHGIASSSGVGGVVEIDEVILLIYRAPHSYTREDVFEIQCHGGTASARQILRAVIAAGARLAEPGEFTRRAFLSGRIDLIQAEAVADLINARSERAAAAAVEQMEGLLSRQFAALYDQMLSAASQLEALLDFPEEDDVPKLVQPEIGRSLSGALQAMQRLLDTWQEGRVLREGVRVVICGRPNVGKSTLLNALLGQSRAIVTETPGTTRDTVEEETVIQGIPVRLIDTAGIRETDCSIESEGVKRAQKALENADLIVLVIDSSQCILPQLVIDLDKVLNKTIIAANKTDLGIERSVLGWEGSQVVKCSLTGADGATPVMEAIAERLSLTVHGTSHATVSERHRRLILTGINELQSAITLLTDPRSDSSIVVHHVRRAMEAIGQSTGKIYTEEILDSIFSRFCVGK